MEVINLKQLKQMDYIIVKELDDISGNQVATSITCNYTDFALGLFHNNKLIGYCTIGYAKGADPLLTEYLEMQPDFNQDSLLLSNVFVHPNYRNRGFSIYMISKAIEIINKKNTYIFITLLMNSLNRLYKKLGFINICEYIMVKRIGG